MTFSLTNGYIGFETALSNYNLKFFSDLQMIVNEKQKSKRNKKLFFFFFEMRSKLCDNMVYKSEEFSLLGLFVAVCDKSKFAVNVTLLKLLTLSEEVKSDIRASQ